MELDNVMTVIRRLLADYNGDDITEAIDWNERASNDLGELLLRYDLEQDSE